MNQKNIELKKRERIIWISHIIKTQKIKDPVTGVESEIYQKIMKQGTMNLGKNEAKRLIVQNSRLKNPKKIKIN